MLLTQLDIRYPRESNNQTKNRKERAADKENQYALKEIKQLEDKIAAIKSTLVKVAKIDKNLKKLAESKVFQVILDNIEWETDNEEEASNLPNRYGWKLRASSEDEAVSKALENTSDLFDYLIISSDPKVTLLKSKNR